MKSKFFRFVLPAFAIVMAVGFAFATEEATISESQTAYYVHPTLGLQEVTIGDECQPQAGTQCEYNGFDLYADKGTSIALRKPNQ